jgi:hypothetical protein
MKIRIKGILYEIASIQVGTNGASIQYVDPKQGLCLVALSFKALKSLLVLEE